MTHLQIGLLVAEAIFGCSCIALVIYYFVLQLETKEKKKMFTEDAIEAGFTKKQAEFMDEMLAKYPHTHDMTEIDGLEEALEGEEDEEEEEE